MNRPSAGRILVLAGLLGGSLNALGQPVQDGQTQGAAPQAATDTRPLQVTIGSYSGKTFLPGIILRFMALVRGPDGAALTEPISYQWEYPSTLSLSTPTNGELLQVPGSVTLGCSAGQACTFKVTARSGTRVGTAAYTVTATAKDASPVWLKVGVKCDPENRTLRQGEPLVLTADLLPAGGGVSQSLVSYTWSVSPALPGRLPSGSSLSLSGAQTRAMKAGQTYVFTLKVKIGLGEVPGSCMVAVVPPAAPTQLDRPRIGAPVLRPGLKQPTPPVPEAARGAASQVR